MLSFRLRALSTGHMRLLFALVAIFSCLEAQVASGKLPTPNKLWMRDPFVVNAPWQPVGRAPRLVLIAAWNGKFYGISTTGYLLVREASSRESPWTIIGHAQQTKAMAAFDGNLYASGAAGDLWKRPPVHRDVMWRKIGKAPGVIAMASVNGDMYAVNTEGVLWVWRNAARAPVEWVTIGRADGVIALAALAGKLYAATSDDRLLGREAVLEDRPWKLMGHAGNAVALTAFNGTLFATAFTPSVFTIPVKWETCQLWATNQLYSEARRLMAAAKTAGRINNRQECLNLAHDLPALRGLLDGGNLTELLTGTCAQCACAAEF